MAGMRAVHKKNGTTFKFSGDLKEAIEKAEKELKEKEGLTYLFISHNLSVVRYISDRIGVMYYGHLVEVANGDDLYKNPLHPYTKALLSAIPEPNPITERTRKRVDYDPERDHDYSVEKPSMVEVEPEHFVYCSPSELEAYRKQLKD